VRLSGAVLWLHVLGGVGWVGAMASFMLGITALGGTSRERRDFALRVAPRLNRLCMVCAGLIPLTGIANLAFAAERRDGPLPAEFVGIVGVKLGLYTLMALMLWRATTRTAALKQDADGAAALRNLVRWYGLMIATGGVALLLGLWLAGVN
jgi:hypothetical protein